MVERVTYRVEKIENGYIVSYNFEDEYIQRYFKDWRETLEFLKINPPKVYEQMNTVELIELE